VHEHAHQEKGGRLALWDSLGVVHLRIQEVLREISRARFASKGRFCGQELCPVTGTYSESRGRQSMANTVNENQVTTQKIVEMFNYALCEMD
jgi:hypothetical protein